MRSYSILVCYSRLVEYRDFNSVSKLMGLDQIGIKIYMKPIGDHQDVWLCSHFDVISPFLDTRQFSNKLLDVNAEDIGSENTDVNAEGFLADAFQKASSVEENCSVECMAHVEGSNVYLCLDAEDISMISIERLVSDDSPGVI